MSEKTAPAGQNQKAVDEYYNLVSKLSMGSGAAELRINYKDEKMHIKTMRTFFFLQAIVSSSIQSYLFCYVFRDLFADSARLRPQRSWNKRPRRESRRQDQITAW